VTIAHELAGWTTLRGPAGNFTYRQSEAEWLELEGFRDLTAWVHVAQATSTSNFTLDLETSPTPDESLFRKLSTTPAPALGAGVYVVMSRGRVATVPLERYLRWAISTPSVTWSITFRIIVCLNPTVPDFRIMRGGQVFTNPALGRG
jgi:hypothetical protein